MSDVWTWIILIALCLAGPVAWVVKGATSGVGRRYRFFQRFYYRLNSLEDHTKTGRVLVSAVDAVQEAPRSRLERFIDRYLPSESGWFSARFPTDKQGYHAYLEIYDALFAPYRARGSVWLLEIGVKKGGSLVLWREVFDADSFIYGIDVNPDVPRFSRDGHMKVLILDSQEGSAVDKALNGLTFDIIIDDGLHTQDAQRRTFAALRSRLSESGVYVIEDVFQFDPADYPAMDSVVIPDRSGQSMVVLCPPGSLARGTEPWRQHAASP